MLTRNPKITAAGLALFTSQAPGFSIAITHVAVGTEIYAPTGVETALKAEFARFPISSGTVISPSSIQIGALVTNIDSQSRSANNKYVGEIGFYVGTTLFAVLSQSGSALFYKSPDIDVPISYVLDFSVLPPGSLTVSVEAISESIVLAAQTANAAAASVQGALATIKSSYYGSFAAAPTTRPDGTARQKGDRYFDSTADAEKTWNGSAWYIPNIGTSDLAGPGGAGMMGFSLASDYPIGKLGYEMTKRGLGDNFIVDDFFKFVRTPTQMKPVYIIGDSITEGSVSSDFGSTNYASIIRRAVNQHFGNRNFGFANFDFPIFENPNITSKFAHTCTRSGFTQGGYAFHNDYFGGTMIQSSTIGEYVEMTFTGKEARVVYVQDAAGAILNVILDGTFVGTIDTKLGPSDLIAGSSAAGAFSAAAIIAPTYGTHTIRLTVSEAKSAKLCGMIYLEHASVVDAPTVFNVGRSSISLCDIPDSLLLSYAQSATSVMALGVNDNMSSKPIGTFRSKLDLYLSQVKNYGGCAIVVDHIYNEDQTNIYKIALREMAHLYDMPYLDFGRMWQPGSANNQTIGFLSGDGVHPTDAGHEFIANAILRTMGLPYGKGSAVGYAPPAIPKTVPTMASGWANIGSGYAGVSYSKSVDGVVRLEGTILNTGSIPAFTTIFTLPVGCRPTGTLLFAVNKLHAFAELEVGAGGEVRLGVALNATEWVSLSGVTFQA